MRLGREGSCRCLDTGSIADVAAKHAQVGLTLMADGGLRGWGAGLIALLSTVPDAQDDDFFGVSAMRITDDIGRLAEWYDQFANTGFAGRSSALG